MLKRESLIPGSITLDAMQDCKDKNSSRSFEWTYKICILRNGKTDWHSARTFRKYARKDQQQPALYTNFLLRCFVQSLAVCLRNSLMITSLELDGIPLAPKYIKILSDGLASNRNLRSLSLIRCQIGDAGCDLLLESLQCNPSLHILNLSSCCLTNRSATCLSLYLKKRRVDLLRSVWNESTLSREDVDETMKEGLQVLILDKNYKFTDIGLRQLIHVLKSDFWLKKLCLRCCGISERGGQITLELLRTNSVITQIDLRENKVPADISQIIHKLLKTRKHKWERVSMQKRLLSHKHVRTRDIIAKRTSQCALKKNKCITNPDYLQLRMQDNCVSQIWCPTYMRRTTSENSKVHKAHDTVRGKHIQWTNVQQMQKRLSLMIKRNQNLIAALENNADFLTEERNRRLSAEEAYHKLQPRLKSLRKKIAVQNSTCSAARYENQAYTNLLNIFDKLAIFTNEEKFRIDGRGVEAESGGNKIKSAVYRCKSQPCKNELAYLWRKRPNGRE
ncbi:centrosomal protein of 78 kDa [Harpegnathos saltator]|nr:centrosomal protein of 78 kDa [Harpegnathos saltator]